MSGVTEEMERIDDVAKKLKVADEALEKQINLLKEDEGKVINLKEKVIKDILDSIKKCE
jgi:hypothetical protein